MLKSGEDGRCCVMFYFLFYYSKKKCLCWSKFCPCLVFFAAQYFHLEKTLESPLACKEVKPVNPKGNQLWIFIGRTDAEAPIIWPPDVKSLLFGKDPDTGKDWRQEKMGWRDGVHLFLGKATETSKILKGNIVPSCLGCLVSCLRTHRCSINVFIFTQCFTLNVS